MTKNPYQQPNETVSIIINVLNGASFIEQSVGSCLIQTYPHIEIIVYDNASTDETSNVVKSIDDDRVRLITRQTTASLGQARVEALSYAVGSYTVFLDCDDYLHPDAISYRISLIQFDSKYLVVTAVDKHFIQNGVTNTQLPIIHKSIEHAVLDYQIVFCGMLIDTGFLRKIAGQLVHYDFILDFIIYFLAFEEAKVAYSFKPTATYRVHPDSMSTYQAKTQIENFESLILDSRFNLTDRFIAFTKIRTRLISINYEKLNNGIGKKMKIIIIKIYLKILIYALLIIEKNRK